jgi:PAS domain S-box-containing protein
LSKIACLEELAVQSKPSARERYFLRMLRPRVIARALWRGWRWLTTVYSDDPIRLALKRGFAHIILAFNFISVILIFAAFATGEIAVAMVTIVSVPMQVFIWWLNRRGTTYGSVLYTFWLLAAFVLVSPPASYAGADTPIPLLLIFPIITATLFIRPQAGLWTLMLTMAVLGGQLYSSDVSRQYIERFLVIGTIDLAAITIFLMVGASIFWRTLRASIAANEALRRQQEQFHYAALATQDAIYDWDLRTNLVLRNEAYQRLYAPDEPKAAVVTWWENHVHPNDYDRVTASMQATFQSHRDFWSDEYRLRRVDGQYATIVDRAYILYDPGGQPVRMIGAMTDITERKQTEARMRALIDAIPDMIVRHDREGRYLEIKAVPSIPLNYAIPDAIGKTVWEMLPHDPKLAEDLVRHIEKVMNTGEMNVQEYKLVVDGQAIYREARTVPADSNEVIMLIRDISDRKQAEAEHLELALARARAELLKEFVDTISHDLKTPLTIIHTSLYLLEKITDPANQRVKLEQIKNQVEHLAKLIQDILTLSRLDTLPDFTAHVLDINHLLLQVQAQLSAVAEERELILRMNLDPNVTLVWGNEEDLQRAFTNLIENALHYTSAGGTVTIQTFEQANQVTVEVSDTGVGIAETDLPRIFEHFYRADQARGIDSGGTGLGLAIVKKIVNQHCGSITVESRIGKGSIFRVSLRPKPPEERVHPRC